MTRAQREIARLDPERDHQRIYHLLSGWEFPWDTVRALEVALCRTFVIPSISKLLDRTGEFGQRPQKRYDDTCLLLALICEHGYERGPGADALARMNGIHARFRIANEDYLYVLSTFVFEPMKWIARYGWRPLTPGEERASFLFWRGVGTRMGIRDIPAGAESFAGFVRDFEARKLRFAESNWRVGAATRDLFLSWMPASLRPLGREAVYALLDDHVLDAFRFPRPLPGVRSAVQAALRARALAVRALPGRRKPGFLTQEPTRAYPHGWTLSDLGPRFGDTIRISDQRPPTPVGDS